MSIVVRGNYTAVRRPATKTARVSETTHRMTRRLVVVGATIIGLLCTYGYIYSTTLFLEHQIELNQSAIQTQLQLQETLFIKDAQLTVPNHVRSLATRMGFVCNDTAVIGTLSNLH